MRHSAVGSLTAIALLCSLEPAAAEWRCDCTTILASCDATVEVAPQWVEIRTDQAQCARVDYFIDGLPFVSVVVDGESREDWISRAQNPRVMVQSCQVCRDNADAAAGPTTRPATTSTTETDDSSLEAIVETQPIYPLEAQSRGIEGTVTVEFVVTPFGDVENPHVTQSAPAGIFDLAAVSAVSRWRYPSDPDRDPITLTRTIQFDLADFIFDTPRANAAVPNMPAQGPVNRCVRESASYNYGEMIEVGLMTACNEEIVVFACSVGTGSYADRWVCSDSESLRNVLISPNDPRTGNQVAVETEGGTRVFSYSDSFFVARSPNTEYWWLACRATDMACREESRQWTRSLDGQTANIDPQQRSRLDVARSY